MAKFWDVWAPEKLLESSQFCTTARGRPPSKVFIFTYIKFLDFFALISCVLLTCFLALTNGEIWVLERSVFQQIMMETGIQKLQEQLKFLRTVPLFSKMGEDDLLKLSDAFEVVSISLFAIKLKLVNPVLL